MCQREVLKICSRPQYLIETPPSCYLHGAGMSLVGRYTANASPMGQDVEKLNDWVVGHLHG